MNKKISFEFIIGLIILIITLLMFIYFFFKIDYFDNAKKILNDRILKFAYADSFEEYANWLRRSDILPVTSKQDFFGISIIEAAYCNTHPILPKRLTYPEIFKNNAKTEFYEDNNELYEKIKSLITSKSYKQDYKNTFLNKYDWDNIVNKYDEEFLDFL